MKKTLLLVVIILIVVGSLTAETKLKMELWNRWTYQTEDGELIKNEMALKRGYLRLEPKFGSNISGRFNLDFFSDDDAGDGAGIKLKYAYLDFSNLLPVKDLKFTVGLMKTYFGTIYSWDYTTIEKDPSDKYKFVSSTDYGFGLSGYFPNGFGTYQAAVYNGEGYKKTGDELNKDMNFLGNIRVTPIPGITIGGSFMMKTAKDSEIPDSLGVLIDNPEREEFTQFAVIGNFAHGNVKILSQYLNQTKSTPNISGSDDVVKTVISLMPTYKINNKIDLVARYDLYDPNSDADDDGKSLMLFGANYHLMRDAKNKPKLMIQANYEIETPEDSDADAVNTMMVQLRWIFSNKLK